MADPSQVYELASTNEAALAARTLGVQTTALVQVIIDSGLLLAPARLIKKRCATYIRQRANVIGEVDPISRELHELADSLEAQ
jgi:hypothetical protein